MPLQHNPCFEPLGFEYGGADAHSWVCNGLEQTCFERTGARPNAYGLLDDLALARAFCADATREQLGEPVLWLPWALLDYSRLFGLPRVRDVIRGRTGSPRMATW